MLLLHAAEALLPPPARYPDLYAVAFAAFSCAHLVLSYLACLYAQWRLSSTEPAHTPFDRAGRVDYLVPMRLKEQ